MDNNDRFITYCDAADNPLAAGFYDPGHSWLSNEDVEAHSTLVEDKTGIMFTEGALAYAELVDGPCMVSRFIHNGFNWTENGNLYRQDFKDKGIHGDTVWVYPVEPAKSDLSEGVVIPDPLTVADLPEAPPIVLTPRQAAQARCDELNADKGDDPYVFFHVCSNGACSYIVEFDDEPDCFTHSPDSGSSRSGYSAKRNADRLADYYSLDF